MRTAALAAALFASSCIIEAPTAGGGAPRPVADRPPPRPVQVPNGANFGDKIELTSVIASNQQGYVGESMRMLLNLKVLAEIDADYMIFVHVEDVDGRTDRLNIDHAPARGTNPTSKWKVGETIRDEFEIPIPPGMNVRG